MKVGHRGFTLIEILLVLVLISLTSVAVISTFPVSDKDATKHIAQGLYQKVQLLNEEALLSGRDYGVRFDEKGRFYQLMLRDSSGWSPLELDKIPAKTDFPEALKGELVLGSNQWDSDRLFKPGSLFDEQMFAEYEEDKKPLPPQVFILSSGELTPFRYKFVLDDETEQTWTLVVKENGAILLLAPGESDEES
ncbi:type II secretion system minor pseudopilin GspH [Vibrio sonorensis]|uniref:type II secretion system minor pseudopilin GspH n=1 Tax=Vibrio sonorensis TaxID=1004316 RepID=UPI0008D99825|nr:type II secretion system minor pseudopilin GspH [Vibrio sonorensis]